MKHRPPPKVWKERTIVDGKKTFEKISKINPLRKESRRVEKLFARK